MKLCYKHPSDIAYDSTFCPVCDEINSLTIQLDVAKAEKGFAEEGEKSTGKLLCHKSDVCGDYRCNNTLKDCDEKHDGLTHDNTGA